jgi:ASC-1-like (ASCH) protein
LPVFITKKDIYGWIKSRRKTIELRRGKPRKGEKIAFLSGKNEMLKGRIIRKEEGRLEEVLNATNYKKIIPIANSLDEAKSFIKQIYPTTEGTFTTYEFEIDRNQ